MSQDKYSQYKEVQVKTANQNKLLIMLYQGCIKFLKLAKEGIEEGDIEKKNEYLQRSQSIINELKNTLDFEQGDDIAQDLDQLYDFMNRQLIAANIQNKAELVDEVRELMKDLLVTWREVIDTQEDGPKNSINMQG
ncbi:flagellar export chaperone FliS [Sporohalobacter salinus]|uniref:flagellar export chaperone FliS n=1 Tax=Sporohalobacter salinus TaxID=1494606 RepID=UPI001960A8C9|nr:flagellar export chaperone FliS [Sporohalobacter salinus]MBM7623038.1 flagellar protein FliS [Sporohalobacter salinus]